MSTENTGAPQHPSGADRPQADQAESTPVDERAAAPSADDAPVEQPTQRIPVRSTEDRDQGPREQPTQQLRTSAPAQPERPAGQTSSQQPAAHASAPYTQQQPGQQPRYGQVAPGSPYQQPYGHQQAPAHQQPYGQQHAYAQQHNPYATVPGSGPGQGGPGQGGPNGPGSDGAPKKRSVWLPVTGAAVAAAVLASLGTAALTGAFDDGGSASLADVGTTRTADEAPVSNSTNSNPDWETVTDAVAASVVAIQTQNAEGSGVVYDDAGHVLTNNHVVSGADTVQVSLSDGRLYEAKVVGTDPTTDLAVVQIQDPPDDLQPAAFGSSDDVTVGDAVLAVGNPLGLANTATTGIVSAVDRPVSASGEDGSTQVVTNAIQIDAAINPGNSGGPLFNAQGQVIGITSSIATLSSGADSQSGSIGLGFAIPVNLAADIADQLIENGSAEHAFLGVTMQDATATADGVTRRGAQVMDVTAGSPAADAGIQTGDVIVAIDDDPVNGAESLTAHVREKSADQQVTLTYVRNGSTQKVDVTLAVREETTTTGEGQGQGQGQDQGQGQGQQDDGSQGADPSSPNNLPDWLRDLLEGGSGN